jgi:Sulfotransferase family
LPPRSEVVEDRSEPAQAAVDQLGPILVTGIPRSGTSWVGKMLDASGRVVYINEPLNPRRPPGQSPGILRAVVHHRFQYITDENESEFLQPFFDLLALNYHLLPEIRVSRSIFDLMRLVKYWNSFCRGRIRRRRPLVDDPYAVFSIEWFVEKLECDAVVVVRHPASIVNSRKRLGYTTDFTELLRQPLLIRDWLQPFENEMKAAPRHPADVVWQTSLLWKMAYHVVRELEVRLPRVHVIRYEDLSFEPLASFHTLFRLLHLPFTENASNRVRQASGGRQEGRRRRESPGRGHSWSLSRYGLARTAFRPLESRAHAVAWNRELSQREISRIRALTEDVARFFYSEADWKRRSS